MAIFETTLSQDNAEHPSIVGIQDGTKFGGSYTTNNNAGNGKNISKWFLRHANKRVMNKDGKKWNPFMLSCGTSPSF